MYKGTLRGQPVAIKSIYSQMVQGNIDELEVGRWGDGALG